MVCKGSGAELGGFGSKVSEEEEDEAQYASAAWPVCNAAEALPMTGNAASFKPSEAADSGEVLQDASCTVGIIIDFGIEDDRPCRGGFSERENDKVALGSELDAVSSSGASQDEVCGKLAPEANTAVVDAPADSDGGPGKIRPRDRLGAATPGTTGGATAIELEEFDEISAKEGGPSIEAPKPTGAIRETFNASSADATLLGAVAAGANDLGATFAEPVRWASSTVTLTPAAR
jgi:hypothetical protein